MHPMKKCTPGKKCFAVHQVINNKIKKNIIVVRRGARRRVHNHFFRPIERAGSSVCVCVRSRHFILYRTLYILIGIDEVADFMMKLNALFGKINLRTMTTVPRIAKTIKTMKRSTTNEN